jgi:hypothetical protein
MTLAEQARLDAADAAGGPPQITVVVQGWAGNKPAPALPGPDETVILAGEATIIEASAPRTNGSLPSPSISDRERLRQQVLARRETVVVEAPVSPGAQPNVIGRMTQGKSYELTTAEKIRIYGTATEGDATMIKKCLYSCSETGPVTSADEAFVCEFHADYLRISASLQPYELTLTRNLVHDLAGGKREFTKEGTLRQAPPKPVTPRIIYEDDGSIRENGLMMRFYTQEQMLAKLNGEMAPSGKIIVEAEDA